ncbi:MAG: ETC complex I subunit [Rhodospirillales bacterium]|nr:ETC complex I subunit [Rhodospirillales bacterium]
MDGRRKRAEPRTFHGSPDPVPARGARARIYRPARNAMQAGVANVRDWVLELEPASALAVEPLMGWEASADPLRQVTLHFPSKEAAIAFAEREGWAYRVFETPDRHLKPKSYADNFQWQGESPPAARTSLPGAMPAAKGPKPPS